MQKIRENMQRPGTYHHTMPLKTPELLEALAKQLRPVLRSIYEKVRTQYNLVQQNFADNQQQVSITIQLSDDSMRSKKALQAYETWQTTARSSLTNPQVEFCLQTTYMQFVRTFFVRACEDNGLTSPHLISQHTLAAGEQSCTGLHHSIYHSFLQLLKEIYCRVHINYSNLLYHHELYDWFTPDEQTIVSLYTLLSRYNFYELSIDVLGRIFNQGYIEYKDRSAKGQFYTPPRVVDYMLDALGIPRYGDNDYTKSHNFLEKTVGDLSCGSGSFLVSAAARKRALLQRLINAHEVSPEYAIQILTSTLSGYDLNPFACFLAEMNLLIQCLPFLINEQGQLCRGVEHFHIYCGDVLEPDIAMQPTDYLVGNPPYVSAGESSDGLLYRDKISNFGIYRLLHQRWDLFVAFFERNLQFLRPETGRLGLIVSNAIETEGYAQRLRQVLSSQYRLLQIDFFPGLRLFQDASVESTIVCIENCAPDERYEVIRRKHGRADCKHFETLPLSTQMHSKDRIFRWRFDPAFDKGLTEGCIPLCAIAYIGTGVEAQSHENFDQVIGGKREKRFTVNDVFLPPCEETTRPADYPDEGVLGDDIGSFYIRCKRHVAYEKYQPYMRAPRHMALFRTVEKLLLGETSGGYYDRAGLFANHSVQVVVPWKALEQAGAIEVRGIQRVYRKSQKISGTRDNISFIAELFDLRYLLAIINSRFMREYINSNMHEGTRKGRIYPDVWKRLPVKVASTERQRQIAKLVDAVQGEYKQVVSTTGTECQRINATINALLSEIETMIVVAYKEPADAELSVLLSTCLSFNPVLK